ncbi:hypothetical protein ACE7GA_24355 [Roseomonas sp. CCTCC AB2023176]|uniref:hypothetical protein n=1 Tax=Roseomonas sp. CCTCC AB2023176 TaxID=3342640 RepID=UPI0035DE8A88
MSEQLPTVAAEAGRLVDKGVISAARKAVDAAHEKVAEAKRARTQAGNDLALAKVQMDKALAGEGEIGVAGAHDQLEAAEKAVRLANLVAQAAERGVEKADELFLVERGRAHQPLFAAGIERRLEAARKFDAGQALLRAAQREFDLATGMLEFAKGQGTPAMIQDFGQLVKPYAEELHRWTGEAHVRHEWWQGWRTLVGEEQAA